MDPEELDYETDWAPEDSWGHQIGVSYRLGECIPVMCDPVGGEVIFTAGGNFYEWNQLNISLRQIISPTTLDEIVAVMKEKGYRGLKFKSVR
jgi:hypothetical protein